MFRKDWNSGVERGNFLPVDLPDSHLVEKETILPLPAWRSSSMDCRVFFP